MCAALQQCCRTIMPLQNKFYRTNHAEKILGQGVGEKREKEGERLEKVRSEK